MADPEEELNAAFHSYLTACAAYCDEKAITVDILAFAFGTMVGAAVTALPEYRVRQLFEASLDESKKRRERMT